MASKKLIISTEEIIGNDAIRRQPQRTTIPYYFVDAVVLAPFGAYPGAVPGLYTADFLHMFEFAVAQAQESMSEYLDKWVYSVASHEEMLEQRVGAKKLIISTEEIIGNDAIRRQPQRTTIPYYFVDAVVLAPFGAYPGAVPGLYNADFLHMFEFAVAQAQESMGEYLEKWVYSVASHEEMLEQRVGAKTLLRLRQEETVREGYYE